MNKHTERALKKVWSNIPKPPRTIKPRDPTKRREETRRQRYGLSGPDYTAMVQKQGGLCAICGKPPTGKRTALFVDHCHQSRKVRGLLCNQCNTGLGCFRDDPKLLELAISYLAAPV